VSTSNAERLPIVGSREPDPELIGLPAPPKRARSLTVLLMALTTIAALALTYSLSSEISYATRSGSPRDVGELGKVTLSSELQNTYARGAGLLGSTGAIRYGRAAESDSFRLAPVLGTDKVWVEIHVPEGFEGPRFIPPSGFAGRLVPFRSVGLRHAGLRDQVRERTGVVIPDDAWILIDGSSPRSSRWALVLGVLFVGFAVWNAIGVGRLLARVHDRDPQPSDAPTSSEIRS
jgi:hypothetical protein